MNENIFGNAPSNCSFDALSAAGLILSDSHDTIGAVTVIAQQSSSTEEDD